MNGVDVDVLNTLRSDRVSAPLFVPNALVYNRDRGNFWVSKCQETFIA